MLEKSFIMRKVGPLPMWAWMGLALGLALAFAVWRRNKEGAGASGQVIQQYELPENIDPQYTFIDQGVTNVTVPWAPPGGGRPPKKPTQPPPVTPPPTQPPPVTPLPPPVAPPPPPSGQWGVPIVPYKSGQPAGTPSTLWGLAVKYYGNGNQWTRIWNAPQNASLVSQRGKPEAIRPGDKFWIPA